MLKEAQHALNEANRESIEQQEALKSQLATVIADKDGQLALKDKEIALLSQKAQQLTEQVKHMKGQLKASKAETTSVMDQLQSLKNNQQMIGESALLESL